MKRVVISDTSCLILLSKLNLITVLETLFTEVWITEEISNEFGEILPGWIKVKSANSATLERILNLNLDKGEASAIALCLEQSSDVLLIIDERKGRRIAKELGINLIGTIGIILRANQLGIIKNLKETIELIEEVGFRISPLLKEQLLNTLINKSKDK